MPLAIKMANISELSDLNLRVGKIIEVEEISTRKPMYKLTIDLGELGTRGIIAGIKPYYSREALLNKTVIVVADLEPKKISDYISEGMVLAAEAGEKVLLLTIDGDLPPGSRVR
jgi:methionyl-tRNA synthetase